MPAASEEEYTGRRGMFISIMGFCMCPQVMPPPPRLLYLNTGLSEKYDRLLPENIGTGDIAWERPPGRHHA